MANGYAVHGRSFRDDDTDGDVVSPGPRAFYDFQPPFGFGSPLRCVINYAQL